MASSGLKLCLVLLFLYSAIATDLFQTVDKDASGLIDRNEFGSYVSSLRASLQPLLESGPDQDPSVTWSADKFLTSLSSDASGTDFITGFFNSLVVILVTEIGDKTFFIAAVLAMRNGRLVVYLGAMGALAIMHILSSLMGFALPALLPRVYTHYASACLFVYFGAKLLKDAYEMNGEGPSEELQEVEEELINKKEGAAAEDETRQSELEEADGSKSKKFHPPRTDNWKVFVQALTLTFLAEWGDRSQIATIALAASKNVGGVIAGGLLGHAFCTGLAVIGGRLLAARISERTVAIMGGVLFMVFAVHAFAFGP